MDALACDEAKALFNFHVGRMLVVQGNYDDAVKRLETSLNWNSNHQLSRFVYKYFNLYPAGTKNDFPLPPVKSLASLYNHAV